MKKSTILVVEDESLVAHDIKNMLLKLNYDVVGVTTAAEEAVNIAKKENPSLVLMDIMLQGTLGGVKAADVIYKKHNIPVVYLSSYTDETTLQLAKETAPFGYILKPFEERELKTTIDIALYKFKMEQELKESWEEQKRIMLGTMEALAFTIEKRDPYTAGHQQRATKLAMAIAERLGFNKDRIEGLRIAGELHDIGKIYIPAEILSNPGKITDAEFNLIKTHPRIGYEILEPIKFPWPIQEFVLQHHERMDGSGYPDGLKGNDIHLEARILAVADVIEAMISHRPYRPALPIQKAIDEIKHNQGILYDKKVVDICLDILTKGDFTFD